MDLPLRTISYIADIGNMVVLMARGKMVRSRSAQEHLEHSAEQSSVNHDDRRLYRMICHVFESEDVSGSAPVPSPRHLLVGAAPREDIQILEISLLF